MCQNNTTIRKADILDIRFNLDVPMAWVKRWVPVHKGDVIFIAKCAPDIGQAVCLLDRGDFHDYGWTNGR